MTELSTVEDTRAYGRRLARVLRAHGDRTPCVELLPAGEPLAYHRAALAGSTLLWHRPSLSDV